MSAASIDDPIFSDNPIVDKNYWVNDLGEISARLDRLGNRAVDLAGSDSSMSEQLFQRYVDAVDQRLETAESRYAVEWQPAAVKESGGQRTWSGLVNGRWVSPRGSARLDAGIADLEGNWTITPSGRYYPEIKAGFDITTNLSKPSVVEYYRSAFGDIPIYDIPAR